jgi:two-component system sensor histidine kinase ChiS
MLSIIIFGILFTVYANSIIKSRISAQLLSVGVIKENQLNDYINRSSIELEQMALDPLTIWYFGQFSELHDNKAYGLINMNSTLKLRTFLEANPQYLSEFNSNLSFLNQSNVSSIMILENSYNLSAKDLENVEEFFENKILEYLNLNLDRSAFDEISLLTLNGVVDLSTSKSEKGKFKLNEAYFINGLNSTYVKNFYISVSSREPTMTVATPIRDADGVVLGVMSGNIRLDRLSNLITERSGLGNTGETIIVNKNHLLVTESRFESGLAFKKTIYTVGVTECLSGNSGIKEYPDYRDVPIIGLFIWMPDHESCLITKIDISEAYEPLDKLYITLFSMGLIILIFSLFISYFISRFLTKSMNVLVAGTEQWAKGNLGHNIEISSNDEIALLSKAFNDASAEMLRSRELEKNYSENLKKELEKRTSDMQKNLEELEQSKKASLNIMDDLSETNKHLQDLDKAKTDFLNVASHELKTPLTAISAYLEILDDYKGEFNEGQLQGLDAIKRNSNQLKMLIGNILEISRLDSGRFDLNITEINIKNKISLLIDNLKILSNNKNITLQYSCDKVETIFTDEMRFEEILNNLIGNAIKFTDEGSINVSVELGKDTEKDFIVVYVSDTGVGIPEDKLTNLFQKFYQVDAGISRRYGGTGLGLSITKKMIELQGGEITVSSMVGKGTTFRFTLPIKPAKKTDIIATRVDIGNISDISVNNLDNLHNLENTSQNINTNSNIGSNNNTDKLEKNK